MKLNLDLEEIATRPSYRMLASGLVVEGDRAYAGTAQDSTFERRMELRQYPSVKRTVVIVGQKYFLQLPSMVFLWVASKFKARRLYTLSGFAAYCAKGPIVAPEDLIYCAPLPNVFERGSVCMPRPENATMDACVETFWQSAFQEYTYNDDQPERCLKADFGSLANWQRLSPQQVATGLRFGPERVKDVIGTWWNRYQYEWFAK